MRNNNPNNLTLTIFGAMLSYTSPMAGAVIQMGGALDKNVRLAAIILAVGIAIVSLVSAVWQRNQAGRWNRHATMDLVTAAANLISLWPLTMR